MDATDRKLLAAIVEKQQRRRGTAPTRTEPVVEQADCTFDMKLQTPWVDWIFRAVKIAYELSCGFLGAAYLDDDLGRRFRSFLQLEAPTIEAIAASDLPLQPKNVGELDPFEGLEERHHYGSLFKCPAGIGCEIRIFETLGLQAIVSHQPDRYPLLGHGVAVLHDVQEGKVTLIPA